VPVASATESEALWRLIRAVSGQVAELQERVADLERRDDLGPLRAELRELARDVAGLRDDLIGLLKDDRGSLIDVLVHAAEHPAEHPAPAPEPPPRAAPVTSLGPPREVRAHLRAWVGWSLVALAGATATALTAAFLALARGCGG
jgi:hypothetical protein